MEPDHERELVERCRRGEVGAFEELVDRYKNLVFGVQGTGGSSAIATPIRTRLSITAVPRLTPAEGVLMLTAACFQSRSHVLSGLHLAGLPAAYTRSWSSRVGGSSPRTGDFRPLPVVPADVRKPNITATDRTSTSVTPNPAKHGQRV